MLPEGVWSGDYWVGDLDDFQEGRENVRAFKFKEVTQPENFEFPSAELKKHVELISPGEETIGADDAGVH